MSTSPTQSPDAVAAEPRAANLSLADAASSELKGIPPVHAMEPGQTPTLDRRADIDAKQAWVAKLLSDLGCDLLLVLEPSNLAWLTDGGASRGLMGSDEQPLLCYSETQRWLVSGNFESQRLFDQELDGLGFMLKEWAWQTGREGALADLCRGRKVAADREAPLLKEAGFVSVAEQMRSARQLLSSFEQACLRQLGKVVVHALEATGRSCNPGETERELAGQLAHRLLRYGATPIALSIAGDGRSRAYRRHGFTSQPVKKGAVLAVTARKYGLYLTAARSYHFGHVDDKLQEEHLAACRICATYMASSWPDAVPHDILTAAQRVFKLTNFEHEWEKSPQGYISGRSPVERALDLNATELLKVGNAIVWGPSIGSALCQDTLLITGSGPVNMTPTESWATAAIKVAGDEFICPYILER